MAANGSARLDSAPPVRLHLRAARWLVSALIACAAVIAVAAGPKWLKIADDELRDPASPAIGVLQEPAEALAPLHAKAPDTVGNQVRWVQLLESGAIQPRTNILPETRVNLRHTEVLLANTSDQPMVLFPHRQHTEWLDCSNCHDAIFEQKAGATKIGMMRVLAGERCGQCHGAVAFPLTECQRCHTVRRDSPEHRAFGGALVREAPRP